MTNTKTYENMTVTVTCKENEDIEMMELIKKMNDVKAMRERTEEFYLPRIKAIGAAKWAEICNQLLGLCETAASFNMRGAIGNFLNVSFHRDDTGERCRMWLSYSSVGKDKGYFLKCSIEGGIADTYYLNPNEDYYSTNWGEDKDGWLAKWDEYKIYPTLRDNLIYSIKSATKDIIEEKNKIVETYKEFAGE